MNKHTHLQTKIKHHKQGRAGNQSNKPVDHDNCIKCNATTKYTKTTPVAERMYYVEGAGQLCEFCWTIIYEIKKDKYEPK